MASASLARGAGSTSPPRPPRFISMSSSASCNRSRSCRSSSRWRPRSPSRHSSSCSSSCWWPSSLSALWRRCDSIPRRRQPLERAGEGLRLFMSATRPSIFDTRRHQMFPILQSQEIARVRRFGTMRSYLQGEALAKVGEVGEGLTIILAGKVDVTQHHESGPGDPIVTHGPGSFMGELAQLAGRPALVDGHAGEPVEALIIPPDRLRALFIAEAELGERIMRALILRRVGLLETGAGGPIIVGRPENGDVLRLEGFLRRKGHPRPRLDPDTDPEAKALIERFPIRPRQ